MRQLAGQEADPPWVELAALVADPYGHGSFEEQKRLVVEAVNMDRGCVTALSFEIDHGKLAARSDGVQNHGQFRRTNPVESLMLVALPDVGLQGHDDPPQSVWSVARPYRDTSVLGAAIIVASIAAASLTSSARDSTPIFFMTGPFAPQLGEAEEGAALNLLSVLSWISFPRAALTAPPRRPNGQ
jgi:hypothetical protein